MNPSIGAGAAARDGGASSPRRGLGLSDQRGGVPCALLELRDVQASYGPYHALFGVSFSVPERSAVALVGSNGAGKSTVVRVASGLVRAAAGRVFFSGRDITRWPAWRIARAGLAHAPEGRSVLASLTVEENLLLAFGTTLGRHQQAEALDHAYAAFGRLAKRRDQLSGTLSGGEQRMLALAKVLVVPKRLLIVDELSLGLAPVVVDEVFSALREILELGTSLLIVEQHVGRVLEIADRIVVLVRGRVVREGPTEQMRQVVSSLLPAPAAELSSAWGTRGAQQPGGGPERPEAE